MEARREADAREQRVNQLAELFRAEREAKKAVPQIIVRPVYVEADEPEEEPEDDFDSVEAEKLRYRLAKAEADISYYTELREREVKLLEYETLERDACSKGSTEWQKWESKVISREKKLYSINTKLTKARQEKYFCEHAV